MGISQGLNTIVLESITELLEDKDNDQSAVKNLLWFLFIELGRAKNINSAEKVCFQNNNSVRLLPALDYIAKNYKNQIYIRDLASLCKTSVRNFRRLFHQAFHCSPLNYINRFRIEMSGILLLNSDRKIVVIAENSGFETLSSYNRNFKNLMGISPREWRRNKFEDLSK